MSNMIIIVTSRINILTEQMIIADLNLPQQWSLKEKVGYIKSRLAAKNGVLKIDGLEKIDLTQIKKVVVR